MGLRANSLSSQEEARGAAEGRAEKEGCRGLITGLTAVWAGIDMAGAGGGIMGPVR